MVPYYFFEACMESALSWNKLWFDMLTAPLSLSYSFSFHNPLDIESQGAAFTYRLQQDQALMEQEQERLEELVERRNHAEAIVDYDLRLEVDHQIYDLLFEGQYIPCLRRLHDIQAMLGESFSKDFNDGLRSMSDAYERSISLLKDNLDIIATNARKQLDSLF